MGPLQSKCDQEHRCTCISHYWHKPQSKYASDIAYICPTALLLCSTYRTHITVPTSPEKQQSAIGTPHFIAKYVPETNIPLQCHICKLARADIRQLCQYIYLM